MRIVLLLICLISSHIVPAQNPALLERSKTLLLMGSRFDITAVATSEQQAWAGINASIAEIQRIEQLISSWDALSQTSSINRQAGLRAVKVDKELFDLIFRAQKISQLTKGAFDISYASMDKIWKFDGSLTKMPDSITIATACAKINWQHILLDRAKQTIFLKEKGMKIGFGAIGKGYAANRAKAILQQMPGIKGGVINAGGDLVAWGESTKLEGWTIQISNPKNKDRPLGWLRLKNSAVITSGDYERYVILDGKRYAHIIDPRTGYPTTGVKSVTIVCPDAEIADALATSVFVLGKEEGLQLVNQLKGIECLIITDKDEIITSSQLQLNYY